MKAKNIILTLLILGAINTFAQDPQYYYIHGRNASNTTDSVFYCGEIAKTDSIDFRLIPISANINLISANAAAAGQSISLAGTNFPVGANCKVFFGAIEATVSAASSTSITVTVPSGISFADCRTTIQVKDVAANQLSNIVKFVAWDAAKVHVDNFNRANTTLDLGANPPLVGSAYKIWNGNAAIENNSLHLSSTGNMVYDNLTLGASAKFIYSADVLIDATDPSAWAGLIFNVTGNGQSYNIFRMAANYMQILGTTDNMGTLSNFYWTPDVMTMPGQVYYHIELTGNGANGLHLKASKMDGTVIVDGGADFTMDAGRTGGKFGFWSLGDLAYFENVSIVVE